MTYAVRRGNPIELGPTLREARRISRKLNNPTWMDKVLSELGEAITFANHMDWQRVLIDTFDDGLPWARPKDRDTLIKFLTDQGLSYRETERLLSVGRGTIHGVLKLNPPGR